MPVDLTKFSEVQLVKLNQEIVARLRYLQEMRMQQQMQNVKVGERVSFHAPGHDPKTGIVSRCNRKTVTVITDEGHQWNVAPVFLSKVIASETANPHTSPHAIQLICKR
jgi:hypothetical protein